MQLLALLLLNHLFGFAWGLEPRLGLCLACEGLAKEFHQRLAATAHREREEIKVGGRIGPDGEATPKKIILYGDSEARFYDIMDDKQLCAKSGDLRKFCYQLTGEWEEVIQEWFFEHRKQTSFLDHICFGADNLNCTPALLEKARVKMAEEQAAKKKEKEEKKAEEEKQENSEIKEDKVQDKLSSGASDNHQESAQSKESNFFSIFQSVSTNQWLIVGGAALIILSVLAVVFLSRPKRPAQIVKKNN